MVALNQRLSGTKLMVAITIVNAVSLGWFGYDQGVFSGVLVSADFKKHFPQTLNSNISGITSSCFSLGAFVGAITAFTYGDKFGRRKSIMLGMTCNIVGAILQITSFQLPQMIIGRVINGYGMGVTSSVCPVFQAECSKSSIRGKLVALGSWCNTAAFCLVSWINFGIYFQGGPLQWRLPLALQLIFPIIVVPTLFFVPESPRWLVLKDRHEEALAILARLEGPGVSVHDPAVTAAFLSISQTLIAERRDKLPIKDVILCRDQTQTLRRLIMSCGTQLMQQFSGVNALGYYLPTLLETSLGYSEEKARLFTAINSVIYLFSACICLLLIDKVGRRKLMLYGSTCMGSTYLISALTLLGAKNNPAKKRVLGNVTTSMFFLYYFTYGTSFAKVPWVFNSEINSLSWRTRGAAAATATNWICSFAVTQFTATGVKRLGWAFYLIFAVICWAYFPIVFCLYPETSRRTLEDMDLIFINYPSIIVCGKSELTQRKRPQIFIDKENERIAAAEASELGQEVLDNKNAEVTKHVEEA
ncbi:hypothetical protein SCUCBS95973_008225 [Sporothrix curviconia]|uniref:Major facilitator superfamily (MFS) profile domain-containing protein n=1 Tax=Sporothrix curviconia TaxID=1260050 RepID=A0ABP0CLR8_9PEZI